MIKEGVVGSKEVGRLELGDLRRGKITQDIESGGGIVEVGSLGSLGCGHVK